MNWPLHTEAPQSTQLSQLDNSLPGFECDSSGPKHSPLGLRIAGTGLPGYLSMLTIENIR